jgi:hypothetical protein
LCAAVAVCVAVVASGCGRSVYGPAADAENAKSIRANLDASESEGAAKVPPVWDGFATVRGQFTISGTAPAPYVPNVNKDVEVCLPGQNSDLAKNILVDDATGGIANVVVYLSAKHKNMPIADSAKLPADAEPYFHDQRECVFLTHVAAVQQGQKLRFKNSEDKDGHDTGHNVSFMTISVTVPAGQYVDYLPPAKTSQPARAACTIHPWMQAFVLVHDNGYFAVTDRQGKFEIPGVPVGLLKASEDDEGNPIELQFRVWHELAGGRGGYLKRLDYGSSAKSIGTGFSVVPAKDQTIDLKVQVPDESFR